MPRGKGGKCEKVEGAMQRCGYHGGEREREGTPHAPYQSTSRLLQKKGQRILLSVVKFNHISSKLLITLDNSRTRSPRSKDRT